MDRTFIPVYQFRLNSIITYCIPDIPFKVSEKSKVNLTGRKSSIGVVTVGIRKRISKVVTLLILSTPTRKIFNPVKNCHHDFKLGFLTLTMPKQLTDLSAKECNSKLLQPMLLWLKRKYGIKNYIWKLEYQKNGTIHYHLTIDEFINMSNTRSKWNQILRNHGLLADYYEKYRNYNPNSIDIHSVKKIDNIESYLIKYLSKSDQDKSSNSKIWDCSESLKKAKYFEIVPESKHYYKLTELQQEGKVTQIVKDSFHIYTFKNCRPSAILSHSEKSDYRKHLNEIRNPTTSSRILNPTLPTVNDVIPPF
jgi:hypothetical protein